ncbi:5-deoxy-glucuronate isomerase [Luethyella okanaganae]|uniref:5-deoxy-glucuronate isomerase n=1 Tax=Luethyella okanaganae TaxID=69372 RepID=A0ABW1VAD7_9MICO
MPRHDEWVIPRGSRADDGWQTVVDSTIPGWQHTGIRVGSLAADGRLTVPAGGIERIVVPLAGSFEVVSRSADGAERRDTLAGRASVFDGPSDVLYLGVGTTATITGEGRFAVAEAPATIVKPTVYLARDEVPVELRGAGRSSRQVHNFGVPGALDAEKLIVCEVITPAENWSSYPAHKHDEQVPGHESRLEEIYYFESEVARGLEAPDSAAPFGLFSTSSSPAGEISIDTRVTSGDVVLVPFGYHGPAVAAPGYDLYYLNVMAGPDPDRVWLISDDPAHGWIRDTWTLEPIDSRLPYTPPSEGERR